MGGAVVSIAGQIAPLLGIFTFAKRKLYAAGLGSNVVVVVVVAVGAAVVKVA
jgi:hypothetical protein